MTQSSTSPITGNSFSVPDTPQDTDRIDEFLARHDGLPVVAVQGLGFVGAVMSLVVANAHAQKYAVVGVDLATPTSYWRIGSLNSGDFPVKAIDKKIDEYWAKVREQGNLTATHDPSAFAKANIIVVDINLDVQKKSGDDGLLEGFDVNLTPFRKAIESIGAHCRADVHVIVETTVPPGTCQQVVKPILEACLTERGLPTDEFLLGHSYERVMPGPNYVDSIENFYRVYSGIDERSADATETFLRSVIRTDEYPLTRLANTNATEMAKVLENSFRAMNIAFIVEWARFAEHAGVNLYEVVQAIRLRPTHRNIMLPGLGVGGYCLTKDPLLASWASTEFFGKPVGLPQSEQAVRINDQMPLASFDLIKENFSPLEKTQVLLLGVSYLNDVGDTRSTPVELLYGKLKSAGAEIHLHDPFVKYWDESGLTVEASLEEVLEQDFEILVISTGHSLYRNNSSLIEKIMSKDKLLVVDTIGLLSSEEIQRIRQKHTLKIPGRGDL